MRYPLFLIVFLAVCTSCAQDAGGVPSFTVVSYNVQNLMDARLDGTEYEEYLPSESWNEENYHIRLKRLAGTLTDPVLRDCDLFVLQEVEHEGVLRDLVTRHLSRWGYGYYAAAKEKDSAISVGLVSRIRPEEVKVHGVPGARPVLEAVFSLEGEEVVVIALHAKSQIGEDTEKLRIECSKTVKAIGGEHPGSLVLVAGDFNEDPDGGRDQEGQRALVLLDQPRTNWDEAHGSLAVSGERGRISGPVWYDPYLDDILGFPTQGTCCYDGAWHQYDQIIGREELFDGRGWEFSSFTVCALDTLLKTDGRPYSWDRNLLSGYSDHLPVMMELVRR